jgi:predicted Rossmann fold nucleotide-binding protein DprA/Smf involved in DNA uptake
MGVPGPVTSAASVGVNQLIRLGQASMVTTAQEVITDLTTHAYSAAAARDQLDECFVPGLVRLIRDEHMTVAAGVPTIWHNICAAVSADPGLRPHELREVLSGGSPVPLSIVNDV